MNGVAGAGVTHVFFGVITKLSSSEMTVRDPKTGETKTFRYLKASHEGEYTQSRSGKLFLQKGEAVKVLYEHNGSGHPQADVINMMDRLPPNVR